jgi:hypothetical protein
MRSGGCRELLHYEPSTGIFTRLVSTSSNARAGSVAGGFAGKGYRRIGVDGRRYRTARLAWLSVTGSSPRDQIDHINLDRADDRFLNLREATHGQNGANKPARKGRLKGAYWHKHNRKWFSKITVHRKSIHLGYFPTPKEAHNAYAETARRLQVHWLILDTAKLEALAIKGNMTGVERNPAERLPAAPAKPGFLMWGNVDVRLPTTKPP